MWKFEFVFFMFSFVVFSRVMSFVVMRFKSWNLVLNDLNFDVKVFIEKFEEYVEDLEYRV